MELEIKEYIEFADFNSKKESLYLVNRLAPTPEEKSIIKNIPFKQGVLDFSTLLGERVFENREITYEFLLHNVNYTKRKYIERSLKQKLMPFGNQKIYDSFNPKFYWNGKCKSVEVEHDYSFNNMKIIVVFDCYPYLLSMSDYFIDFFDNFDFNEDTASYTKFKINGSANIVVGNPGSISIKPEIISDANIKLTLNDDEFNIKVGKNNDYYLSLKPGANYITAEGTGTIQFRFRYEVMG